MDGSLLDWPIIEHLAALRAFESEWMFAGLLFLGTTAVVALCIPGVIVPLAVSSGSLLGSWAAVPVALGALAGSLLLFVGVRHAVADRMRARLGEKLHMFELRFARYGLWYVVALRLCGAPHFLVTAASALLPLRTGPFAAATFTGFAPVVAIAAAAGAAI